MCKRTTHNVIVAHCTQLKLSILNGHLIIHVHNTDRCTPGHTPTLHMRSLLCCSPANKQVEHTIVYAVCAPPRTRAVQNRRIRAVHSLDRMSFLKVSTLRYLSKQNTLQYTYKRFQINTKQTCVQGCGCEAVYLAKIAHIAA